MAKHKENGILFVPEDVLEWHQNENRGELYAGANTMAQSLCIPEEATVLDKETELYNTVYKEISEIVGLMLHSKYTYALRDSRYLSLFGCAIPIHSVEFVCH